MKSFIYKLYLLGHIYLFLWTIIINVWTSKLLKLLFYISFIFTSFLIIYSFLYTLISLDLKSKFLFKIKFARYLYLKSNIIIRIIPNLSLTFILYFNLWNYRTFQRNCPFTLSSDFAINDEHYYNKRCELYNQYNNNSRYKYQYICSYNPYDDFKNIKSKDGLNKILCTPKITNITNNDIINKFEEKYNDTNNQLYYCNSADKIIKDEYIKDDYCNMKKDIPDNICFIYNIFQTLTFFVYKFYIDLDSDILRIHLPLANQIAMGLIYDYDEISDNSTDNDENDIDEILFQEEDDENIIVDNKEVSNIGHNIKDYYGNKEKVKQD